MWRNGNGPTTKAVPYCVSNALQIDVKSPPVFCFYCKGEIYYLYYDGLQLTMRCVDKEIKCSRISVITEIRHFISCFKPKGRKWQIITFQEIIVSKGHEWQIATFQGNKWRKILHVYYIQSLGLIEENITENSEDQTQPHKGNFPHRVDGLARKGWPLAGAL